MHARLRGASTARAHLLIELPTSRSSYLTARRARPSPTLRQNTGRLREDSYGSQPELSCSFSIPSSFVSLMEEALVLVVAAVLLLSPALVASDFCVCRSDQSTAALQKAIDYSCGQGADCTAILQNGVCYNPDDVTSHCSWAVNSYFQKYRSSGATCDFTGAATLSSSDPSFSGCTFPSSASAAGTTTGTGTTTTGTGTTTTGTFSPGTTGTGYNGTGTGSSLGPTTGTGSMDGTAAAAGLLPRAELAASLAILLLSFLALP